MLSSDISNSQTHPLLDPFSLGFPIAFPSLHLRPKKNGCLIPARRRAPVRPSAARAAGRRTRGLWLDRPGMNQMLWLPAGGYNRCVCIYIYMCIYICVITCYNQGWPI